MLLEREVPMFRYQSRSPTFLLPRSGYPHHSDLQASSRLFPTSFAQPKPHHVPSRYSPWSDSPTSNHHLRLSLPWRRPRIVVKGRSASLCYQSTTRPACRPKEVSTRRYLLPSPHRASPLYAPTSTHIRCGWSFLRRYLRPIRHSLMR